MKILINSILLLTFLAFYSCSNEDAENLTDKQEITNGKSISAIDLVQNFNDRKLIFDQVFNVLVSTGDDHTFKLSGGQDNKNHAFTITNKEIDLSGISTERVKVLYTSFLTKKSFIFKDIAVDITKIAHEDGSGGNLLVYGIAEKSKETVNFYYSTNINKQHWLDAPQ